MLEKERSIEGGELEAQATTPYNYWAKTHEGTEAYTI